MKNKKILSILLALTITATFTACGKSNADVKEDTSTTTVKVGVVGESNEMWTPVIEEMAKEGINVELISFTDYATPNRALSDGETDLNAFQHYAYLNKEIENNGYEITAIGDTFISAMNIYSDKVSSVSEIAEGAKIAVPNDATNEGRALKILEAAKLIEIDVNAGDSPELGDITQNPLNIEFVEVDAANVYALLPDVTAAVINCNYALDNGLNPGEDSIFQDNVSYYSGNSYVNLIAARTEDANNETYLKIVEAYQSDAVKVIYADTFKGAYIPAWK
ncbi:MAG: MetQ/NlpA family ABC transporter substrate-binding protein [Sedimentibacter saalensis]|uniref:MetQ/NlpA family ABC transporter substrate-binding protein n=1 Tax=Sedimentibacter saalensis TaxID=130788 RepID=UPI00315947B3